MSELPHNIEAEQQLLGAVMNRNELLDRVAGLVTRDSFYDPVHADIFAAITANVESGLIASPVSLASALMAHEGLQQLGGTKYLAGLSGASVSSYAVRDYAQIIRDAHKRRELIAIADDMRHAASSDNAMKPEAQIESAESRLYALAEEQVDGKGPVTFMASITKAIETAHATYQRGGGMSGIPTGLVDLDTKMGGLNKSDLIILAGRPSMGKTSLATNMAFNIARAYNKERGEGGVVAFFSLEMSHDQLTARILADAASISSHAIRNGEVSESQMRTLLDTSQQIASLPIVIDDTPAITVAQLLQRARQIKRTHGLDLLIVDYLQLMRGPSKSQGNRVQEISEISMGLKAIAKELNVPVIALSQLSRQVETREDKRPQLSDLRESGSIEQDADIVMFVFRKEYYLEREKPEAGGKGFAEWAEEFEKEQGTASVIIGKNRHGSVGTVKLSFEGEFTRFGNLAHDWQR